MERQLATTKEEEKKTNTHSMHSACRSEMNARQRDRQDAERTSATVAHFFAFVLSIARFSQPVVALSIRGNLACTHEPSNKTNEFVCSAVRLPETRGGLSSEC